jgi:hypothetical protein
MSLTQRISATVTTRRFTGGMGPCRRQRWSYILKAETAVAGLVCGLSVHAWPKRMSHTPWLPAITTMHTARPQSGSSPGRGVPAAQQGSSSSTTDGRNARTAQPSGRTAVQRPVNMPLPSSGLTGTPPSPKVASALPKSALNAVRRLWCGTHSTRMTAGQDCASAAAKTSQLTAPSVPARCLTAILAAPVRARSAGKTTCNETDPFGRRRGCRGGTIIPSRHL